jgi:hypothetical protein
MEAAAERILVSRVAALTGWLDRDGRAAARDVVRSGVAPHLPFATPTGSTHLGGEPTFVEATRLGSASYFEIVMGIPTFSIRPMVVWNKMLRMRNVVRSHTVSFTEW